MNTVKCPWCGRVVGFSKSRRLEPHVGPGGVKCVGVGQPEHQVMPLRDSMDSRLSKPEGGKP